MPKPKPKLNEDQYIEEINRQLRQHDLYRNGMAFVPYPPGTTGHFISGYTVTGPFELMGVYAQITHQVNQQFELAL